MAKYDRDGARGALAEAERRFGAWREGRRRGQKIPKELWQAAVDLVGRYSPEQVADRLKLNNRRLEKHLEARHGGGVEEQRSQGTRATGFVEVGRLGDGYADECTIEAEERSGWRLVVRLNGGACAQATEIVEALRGERG